MDTNKKSISPGALFLLFLRLGLMSFGGPLAHLGFFRREFVERRALVSSDDYAAMMALCQILPGATSSQTGMLLGHQLAGVRGALLAFLGFTLPSAVLMSGFGLVARQIDVTRLTWAMLAAKGIALAIVGLALWKMARSHWRSTVAVAIGVVAMLATLVIKHSAIGVCCIVLGGLISWLAVRGTGDTHADTTRVSLRSPGSQVATVSLALFAAFLLVPVAFGSLWDHPLLEGFFRLFRVGALIFGGGHVVLPMLQLELAGSQWMSAEQFASGYGLVQLMPGPLFTYAGWVGAVRAESGGILMAVACLIGIFLPSFLILFGALPHWSRWMQHPVLRRALPGIHAVVTGLLAAAWLDLGAVVWVGGFPDGEVMGATSGLFQGVALSLAPIDSDFLDVAGPFLQGRTDAAAFVCAWRQDVQLANL